MTIELTVSNGIKAALVILALVAGKAEATKAIRHAQARFAAAQAWNK
jgi:hypothetical protein